MLGEKAAREGVLYQFGAESTEKSDYGECCSARLVEEGTSHEKC